MTWGKKGTLKDGFSREEIAFRRWWSLFTSSAKSPNG